MDRGISPLLGYAVRIPLACCTSYGRCKQHHKQSSNKIFLLNQNTGIAWHDLWHEWHRHIHTGYLYGFQSTNLINF